MPGLDWTDPWVIGVLAGVGGVLALVGVTCSSSQRRRLRVAAVVAGFLGIAGLASATGLSIRGLTALRKPPAKAPQPAAPQSVQEVLERFRKSTPADRLAMVQRLPEGEQGWHTVGRGDVTATVVERGTVEPVVVTDVVCEVRSREADKPATTIKSVVADGTLVKKGQVLVELDDAPLQGQLRELKGVVAQQQAALARAEKDQVAAGVAAARAALDAVTKRIKELEADIAHCKPVAPHDGLVAFYVPEQGRPGAGGRAVVAKGAPVRQGQKLLRVYDLSKLQVKTRVPEALVSRVRAGQEARVRVDAFPGRRLSGRVTDVAKVAAQQSWLAAGVKVYPTTVALEGDVRGLKPGMSAEVTIVTDQRKGVLRLPVGAVLGAGAARWVCYVRQGAGIEERELKLGTSGGGLVEVREGVKEGERVIGDLRGLAVRLAVRPGTAD